METGNSSAVFDYRGLRLVMGLIALTLPEVAVLLAGKSLSSISASYYSNARDIFVGQLFVVGAFLFAYNGHSEGESHASKVASVAALCVASFPVACDSCAVGAQSIVHYVAASVLFAILAYFCFIPFQKGLLHQPGKGKARRRWVYLICGSVMVGCMLVMAIAYLLLPPALVLEWRVTFWGEAIALTAFGLAWIASGKTFSLIADEEERYHPLRRASGN